MRLRRVLLGALSSTVWPAIVVCIPAGITFFSTRVLAEGAVSSPAEPCDASAFAACEDAAEHSYCSSEGCKGARCACTYGQTCIGSTSPVQSCREVSTCESRAALRAACDGMPTGSSCTPPGSSTASGSCVLERCLLPDDGGFFESTAEVFCSGFAVLPPPPADAGRDASAPATSPPTNGERDVRDSGGCVASGGTTQGAALLLGLPLALSLRIARRRRRR